MHNITPWEAPKVTPTGDIVDHSSFNSHVYKYTNPLMAQRRNEGGKKINKIVFLFHEIVSTPPEYRDPLGWEASLRKR